MGRWPKEKFFQSVRSPQICLPEVEGGQHSRGAVKNTKRELLDLMSGQFEIRGRNELSHVQRVGQEQPLIFLVSSSSSRLRETLGRSSRAGERAETAQRFSPLSPASPAQEGNRLSKLARKRAGTAPGVSHSQVTEKRLFTQFLLLFPFLK